LKNGARKIIHKRVEEEAIMRGTKEKLLKDISDNVEEEGREDPHGGGHSNTESSAQGSH
jgi:hypothetical protein